MAKLTTLLNFNTTNGASPAGTLITDANGDLFGTTQMGGAGAGTVFELVNDQGVYGPLTALAEFVPFPGTDFGPLGGLVADSAGNLFGTTQQGGAYGLGSVFEIVNTSTGYAKTPITLISFDHQNGAWPEASLTIDGAGNLFGTTLRGNNGNGGAVFEVAKTAAGYASETTTLLAFSGPNGADSRSGLLADSQGNLFGTTEYGGAGGGGAVFELVANGGSYTPVILVSFSGANGALPQAGLVADVAGNLFGTTSQGGSFGLGTVYEIVKSGGGYASTPLTLINFDGVHGSAPQSALIIDAAGDLFGTTSGGGAFNNGTVFEIAATGSGYASTPTTLLSFSGTNGSAPIGGLVARDGTLFGTTSSGGTGNAGTVFELTDAGFQLTGGPTPTPTPTPTPAPTPTPTPTPGASAAYSVVVTIAANFTGADWPYFILEVDGVAVSGAVPVNTKSFEDLGFSLNLTTAVAHDIQIVTASPPDPSRTLTVRDIVLNGQTISADSAFETYVSSHGTIAGTGQMPYGGEVDFNLPATFFGGSAGAVPTPTPTPAPTPTPTPTATDRIVVNASASLAGGLGAHFDLLVDGIDIGQATVGATLSSYSFDTNLTQGQGHDIQIVYDNDAVIGGEDRNLLLQSISINGQTIGASSTLEVFHAPFNPGPGDLVGNGNMYWNGTAEFNLPASYFPVPTPTPTPTPTPSVIEVGGYSQYTTIQQGIQAAEQAGVHTVLVDPGTYTEDDILTAADNGLTITTLSGGVTVVGSLSITNGTSITVSGLKFQGDGSNTAITALNSQHLTITDNVFDGTGQAVLLDGSTNSSVSDNLMTDTANSAIEAKNGADGNTFDSNVIDGDGAANTIGAIYLHGANNSVITHNEISNTAGAAISLADFFPPGTTGTQNNNSTIAYNKLDHVDTMSQDSGAIYILGRSQDPSTGISVTMNFIGATGSPALEHAVGIYLDDNTSGVSVTRNIVQAVPGLSDAFEVHGGSNNTISGNIFDMGPAHPTFGLFQRDESDQLPVAPFSQLSNNVVTGNIYVTESASPHDPGFGDLTGGIGDISISGNDFWAYSNVGLNVGGVGAQGDSAAAYNPPAAQAAQSLSDYASWSGAGINFQSIETSLIGLAPTGPHPYT